MNRFFLYISLLLFISSCDSKKNTDKELHRLAELLSGSFSSIQKTKEGYGYDDIYWVNIPIWKEKSGYWMYSKIYNAKTPSSIISQKVLHLERVSNKTLRVSSYIIPNQEVYINEKGKLISNKLSIKNLELLDGCELYFKKRTSSIYVGKTNSQSCLSPLENVAYTVSHWVISKNKISIWTKGFNTEEKQVWGNLNGPNKYRRTSKN